MLTENGKRLLKRLAAITEWSYDTWKAYQRGKTRSLSAEPVTLAGLLDPASGMQVTDPYQLVVVLNECASLSGLKELEYLEAMDAEFGIPLRGDLVLDVNPFRITDVRCALIPVGRLKSILQHAFQELPREDREKMVEAMRMPDPKAENARMKTEARRWAREEIGRILNDAQSHGNNDLLIILGSCSRPLSQQDIARLDALGEDLSIPIRDHVRIAPVPYSVRELYTADIRVDAFRCLQDRALNNR